MKIKKEFLLNRGQNINSCVCAARYRYSFISIKYLTFHYNQRVRYSVTRGNIITHKIKKIPLSYNATMNGQIVFDWVSVTDIGHQILGAIIILGISQYFIEGST